MYIAVKVKAMVANGLSGQCGRNSFILYFVHDNIFYKFSSTTKWYRSLTVHLPAVHSPKPRASRSEEASTVHEQLIGNNYYQNLQTKKTVIIIRHYVIINAGAYVRDGRRSPTQS